MTQEQTVREAINLIWRNHPSWPSTFSKCPNEGCENLGRGGSRCADCAEKELASVVGKRKAAKFHNLVKEIKTLEHEFYAKEN